MPLLVVGTLLLVGLALLSSALGLRILKLFKLPINSRLESVTIAGSLGLGLLQFVPFTLFALGVGKPICFRIVLAALLVLLFPEVFRILRSIPRAFRALEVQPLWQRCMIAIFTLLLIAVFIRSLCPITD